MPRLPAAAVELEVTKSAKQQVTRGGDGTSAERHPDGEAHREQVGDAPSLTY